MEISNKTEEILTPFIQLAHIFRNGDAYSLDSALTICNALIIKYLAIFQDKKMLTELLASINQAYQRRDHVGLADIYEYEMTAYLKAEIENFLSTNGADKKQ
ncbi:hypothetical protein LCL85_04935 [Vibrio alginolyticus]|nr:hypothetical protein [Vibrio alginolyticus]